MIYFKQWIKMIQRRSPGVNADFVRLMLRASDVKTAWASVKKDVSPGDRRDAFVKAIGFEKARPEDATAIWLAFEHGVQLAASDL